MKKLSPKETPSNLKNSRQNIDQIGRTSQGAPQKPFKVRKTGIAAKSRAGRKQKYTLKEAMAIEAKERRNRIDE